MRRAASASLACYEQNLSLSTSPTDWWPWHHKWLWALSVTFVNGQTPDSHEYILAWKHNSPPDDDVYFLQWLQELCGLHMVVIWDAKIRSWLINTNRLRKINPRQWSKTQFLLYWMYVLIKASSLLYWCVYIRKIRCSTHSETKGLNLKSGPFIFPVIGLSEVKG